MSTPARPSTPGWRIGTLSGTPVYLGRTWPLIFLLLMAVVAPSIRASGRSLGYAVFVAAASAVMLLFSVLVHEAAHALVAQWRGHGVDRIVADVWGGHTVYDTTGVTPLTNALVAAVGPFANLVLALVAWLLQPVAGSDLVEGLLGAMTYTNLFVGLFNLLPGLPLDGGHIVSSLVWQATGRRGAGLTAAGWLGRVVAVGSVVWFLGRPVAEGEQPSVTTLVWTGMIAFFLWRGASSAVRSGRIHDATAGPVREVLEPVWLVAGSASVADALAAARSVPVPDSVDGGPAVWVVVTDPGGWPYAVVDRDAAASVPPELAHTTTAAAVCVAQPPEWVVALPPDAVLTELVRLMSERSLGVAVVVDETSRTVAGLATADRVNAVVGAQLQRRSVRRDGGR